MVAIKAKDVESVLRAPAGNLVVFLLYGPDAGLVGERARALAHARCSDPADPFLLVRLEGDRIAEDPGRLMDEAGTIGMFGGRRVIWITPTARSIVASVTAVLDQPPPDATIVLQAGDLSRNAPLRVLCERAPQAAALPCYSDSDRDLGTIVDSMLSQASVRIARDARGALLERLGADRQASRAEIEKLILYAHPDPEIRLEHVEAIVGDVSASAFDGVVDAAFGGDRAALEADFLRLMNTGGDAGALLLAATRHALHLADLDGKRRQSGASASAFVDSQRGLHFSRKAALTRQLETWNADRLLAIATQLHGSVARSRQIPALKTELARQTLWAICERARRGAR